MFAELLTDRVAGICRLSPDQVCRLEQHYGLLVCWNRVLNLTGIRTVEDAVERHYCESLFLAAHLPPGKLTVADIGSGAGFPGVPVAILRPYCHVTLIESRQRKAAFLKEASRELGNVRVLAERAESIAETFDWVISRAVKYSEIGPALKRLGRNAELLSGELQLSDMRGFDWQPPIRLPWGTRRYLYVSRETGST